MGLVESRWIVSPLNDVSEIQSRQDVITFYQQPQLRELRCSLEKEMKRLCDLPAVCKRIIQFKEKLSDWLHLVDAIAAFLEMGRINEVMLKYSSKDCSSEFVSLSPSILQSDDIRQFSFFLQQVFDVSKSVETKEIVIRNGVDLSLDEYRMVYNQMASILDECSVGTKQELLQTISVDSMESFESWGYEFLPRSRWIEVELNLVGYVFAIAMSDLQKIGTDCTSFE